MELVTRDYRITLADVQADPSLRERITVNDLHRDPALLRNELERMFEGREHGIGWLPNTTGYRPHFPPADYVWESQGVCPQDGFSDPERWARAWAVLQRLHAEYEASREAEPDAVGESTSGHRLSKDAHR